MAPVVNASLAYLSGDANLVPLISSCSFSLIVFRFPSSPIHSIILENDSASIVQRVVLKNDDLPIGEQTVAQVFQNAKENFKWSLLRS